MKLPLVTTLKNRGSTTAKDGRMLNCFAEQRAGVWRAVKRPAINPAFDNLGAGPGGGLFTVTTPDGDNVVAIVDDVLTNSLAPSVRSLSFSVQPDESDINVAITPSVVVHALNSLGQVASGFTGTVDVALSTNPTGATLGGTVSVSAVAGVATFSNLTLNRSGQGFRLRATSGSLRAPTSVPFNIPTRLVFTEQPVSTQPDTVMDPVEVTIQDPGGNVDPNYNGNVTLTLFGTAGGVLSGTKTKAAVNGVATFDDLEVDQLGTYDLLVEAQVIAGCYPPSRQFSNSFTISDSFTYAMVAQDSGAGLIGYAEGGLGSLTPDTYLGGLISQIANAFPGASNGLIVGIPGATGQDFFTSITVGGITRLSADAVSYAGGQWEWDGATVITAEGPLVVSITP